MKEQEKRKTFEVVNEIYDFRNEPKRFKNNSRGDEMGVVILKRYFDLATEEKYLNAKLKVLKDDQILIECDLNSNSFEAKTDADYIRIGKLYSLQNREVEEATITKRYNMNQSVIDFINLEIVVKLF